MNCNCGTLAMSFSRLLLNVMSFPPARVIVVPAGIPKPSTVNPLVKSLISTNVSTLLGALDPLKTLHLV